MKPGACASGVSQATPCAEGVYLPLRDVVTGAAASQGRGTTDTRAPSTPRRWLLRWRSERPPHCSVRIPRSNRRPSDRGWHHQPQSCMRTGVITRGSHRDPAKIAVTPRSWWRSDHDVCPVPTVSSRRAKRRCCRPPFMIPWRRAVAATSARSIIDSVGLPGSRRRPSWLETAGRVRLVMRMTRCRTRQQRSKHVCVSL